MGFFSKLKKIGKKVWGGVKKVGGGLLSSVTGGLTDGITGLVSSGVGQIGGAYLDKKLAGVRGEGARKYLDAAFPGTTPWEQLGSSAGGSAGSGQVSPTMNNAALQAATAVKTAKIAADAKIKAAELAQSKGETGRTFDWLINRIMGSGKGQAAAAAAGVGATGYLAQKTGLTGKLAAKYKEATRRRAGFDRSRARSLNPKNLGRLAKLAKRVRGMRAATPFGMVNEKMGIVTPMDALLNKAAQWEIDKMESEWKAKKAAESGQFSPGSLGSVEAPEGVVPLPEISDVRQ